MQAKHRYKAPVVAAIAGLVAFGGANAAVSLAQDAPSKGDGHGPVTDRAVVTSGSSPNHGRYEILTSTDATGALCVGIRFLDLSADSTLPELAEGCGPDSENQVGSIAGPKTGTLFFGRVAKDAAEVAIEDRGGKQAKLKLNTSRGNDGNVYVLKSVPETYRDFTASASASNGRALGRVDPGSLAGRTNGFAPAH